MNLFICSTPYHLYIAALLSMTSAQESQIYLTSKDSGMNEFFKSLDGKVLGNKVELVCRKESNIRLLDSIFGLNDIRYIKELKKRYSTVNCNLFPWNPYVLYSISHQFFRYCDEVYLVEDGANVYDFPKPKQCKLFLKRYLLGYDLEFYKHHKVSKILVQYPQRYIDFPREKLELLDIRSLESKLSTQQKSDIIALFINSDIQHSIEALSDAKIVLTQPLSEDGYITEQEKIGKYLGIIRDLERSNVVILKKHPRDKTRYDFENVIVLDGTFPSEIFNLLNIVFDTAISICSSSIDNINAHRKIETESEFLKNKRS